MIIIIGFSFCSFAQVNNIDSLSLIYNVYQLEEINKGKFDNPKHPERSVFIMYQVKKDEQHKVFQNRHLKVKDVDVYFYTRAYIVGFDINYWLVVDKIEWGPAKSKIVCRTVRSSDAWIESLDRTDLCIVMEFKKDGNEWIQTMNKVTRR